MELDKERSFDRTYEELKLIQAAEQRRNDRVSFDRTYEELKLNCVAWQKAAEMLF